MDRERAIEKLNDIRCHVKETSAEEQALVMAMNALKAQFSQQGTTKDAISRQAALEALRKCQTYLYDARDPELKIELSSAEAAISNLPTIQPVATDTNVGNNSEIPNSSDCISRQQAIDAIAQCTNCGDENTLREYVLKHSLDNGWTGGILEALDAVKDLPPAQPERKRGEWVYNSPVTMKCNRCGLVIKDWDWHRFKICPNCGADMRGEQDETD